MRVAITANTAWNLWNFRLGLIGALQEAKHHVTAFAPRDAYASALEEKGVAFHHIPMDGKTTNPVKDVAYLVRLFQAYRKLRPEVVLHFTIKPNIYGTLAAGVLGIPVIDNITGLGNVFLKDTATSRIVKFLYRAALSYAGRIFFQNPDDRRLFLENRIVTAGKTDLLPGSGIDTGRFAPLPKDGPGGRLVFLLIARLIWEKGIREYVQAAGIVQERHPDTEFQLVGELRVNNPSAIPRGQIDAWQKEGRIRYLGYTDDIRSVIRNADCVVLPSYYREGVPRTLLEAASMAKPVVTTDSIGCRETVEDGVNGFLCRPRDPADLAEKLIRFIGLGEEERRRMGGRGREKVRAQFDERIVIGRYLAEISRLQTPAAPPAGRRRRPLDRPPLDGRPREW